MTVESTARKQTYSGGQNSLTFTFRALKNHPEYIKALKTLIATGVETDLTYGADFTVSLNSDGIGGVVSMTPSVSTAYTVTVYRSTDDLQESDYDDFNQFPADTVEEDFDRRTLISQEREEEVSRTAKVPISSSITDVVLPSPLDGYALVWSGSGGKIINSNLIGPSGSTGAAGANGATGPSGSSALLTRASFTNGSLSAGILTITHSLGLSAPYTIVIWFADNNGKQVYPDLTFLTNTIQADFSNFGTLSGTWGYGYWKN